MPDQAMPERRARLRQAVAILEKGAVPGVIPQATLGRQQAERAVADRCRSPKARPLPAQPRGQGPCRARRAPKAVIVTVSGPGVVTVSPPHSTMP